MVTLLLTSSSTCEGNLIVRLSVIAPLLFSLGSASFSIPAVAQNVEVTDSAAVQLVQSTLNALGMDAGPADGALGPQTRRALRRFEAAAGLPIDGRLDYQTALAVLKRTRIRASGGGTTTMHWEGEAFTLRDVTRRCEVWRWSPSWGEIECRSGDWEDEVEDRCEVWFPSLDGEGQIDCRESEFRPIERNCSAVMYSDSYGDIIC